VDAVVGVSMRPMIPPRVSRVRGRRSRATATTAAIVLLLQPELEVVLSARMTSSEARFSFSRAMSTTNVSPNTITAYGAAVRQFATWLGEHDYPTDVTGIKPRLVEE
jgi:hypothetical protein